jgi:hypothetical protein
MSGPHEVVRAELLLGSQWETAGMSLKLWQGWRVSVTPHSWPRRCWWPAADAASSSPRTRRSLCTRSPAPTPRVAAEIYEAGRRIGTARQYRAGQRAVLRRARHDRRRLPPRGRTRSGQSRGLGRGGLPDRHGRHPVAVARRPRGRFEGIERSEFPCTVLGVP